MTCFDLESARIFQCFDVMRILLLLLLISTSAFADSQLADFHQPRSYFCNSILDPILEALQFPSDKFEGAGPIEFAPNSQDIVQKSGYILDYMYNCEEKGKSCTMRNRRVTYLDEVERLPYQVFVKGDLLVDRHGIPVCAGALCKGIAVMDMRGRIYFSTIERVYNFHHSSFVSGGRVAYAGTMTIQDGVLMSYSNSSGHYAPERNSMAVLIMKLRASGLTNANFGPAKRRFFNSSIFTRYRLP